MTDTIGNVNPDWEAFVDYDFLQPPADVKPNMTHPRDDRCGAEFDVAEDAIDIIPRDKWDEMIASQPTLGQFVKQVRDQDGVGSCATESASQVSSIIRNIEIGKQFWIEPCSISIYQTTSGGRDRGSSIQSNLRFVRDKGFLPADTEANKHLMKQLGLDTNHVMRNRVFPQHYPSGWEETAKHFRLTEWYDIESIEGFVTALLLGFPVSYGRSGHSITAIGLTKRNGSYYVPYVNSWGRWGDSGFDLPYGIGYDRLDTIARAIPSYGAWTIRQSVITEPFASLITSV